MGKLEKKKRQRIIGTKKYKTVYVCLACPGFSTIDRNNMLAHLSWHKRMKQLVDKIYNAKEVRV